MVKSASCCCVSERRPFSNLVTFKNLLYNYNSFSLCVLQFVLLFKSINVELDDITTACMDCIREMTNPEKVLQHNYKHALTIVIDKFNSTSTKFPYKKTKINIMAQ